MPLQIGLDAQISVLQQLLSYQVIHTVTERDAIPSGQADGLRQEEAHARPEHLAIRTR